MTKRTTGFKTRGPDGKGLTKVEKEFIKHYTNPESGRTFGDGTHALLATSPHMKATSANSGSSAILKRPLVQKALKEILDKTEYKTVINKRLMAMLEDEETRPRDVIGAIDLWSKITGAYAPEKTVNVNLNKEDRESKYDEILAKVRGAQSTVAAPQVLPTPILDSPPPPEEPTTSESESQDFEDEDFEEYENN